MEPFVGEKITTRLTPGLGTVTNKSPFFLSSISLVLLSLYMPTWTSSSFSGSLPSPLLNCSHSSVVLLISPLSCFCYFLSSLRNCLSSTSSFIFPGCYSHRFPMTIYATCRRPYDSLPKLLNSSKWRPHNLHQLFHYFHRDIQLVVWWIWSLLFNSPFRSFHFGLFVQQFCFHYNNTFLHIL